MLAAALAAVAAERAEEQGGHGDPASDSFTGPKTPSGGSPSPDCYRYQRHPRSSIGSRFANLFLRGRSLRRLIAHLCNACPGQVQDPITHVACIMMTSPVSISISEAGVCPFQDHPLLLYPFHMMTLKQRRFLRDLVVYFQNNYHRLQPPSRFGPGKRALCQGAVRAGGRVARRGVGASRVAGQPVDQEDQGAGEDWHEEDGGSILRLQGGCLVEASGHREPSAPGRWAGDFLGTGVMDQAQKHAAAVASPVGSSSSSAGGGAGEARAGVGRTPAGHARIPGRGGRGSPSQRGSAMYLKAENILESVCKCVFSSSVHKDTYRRLAICNIFLQRISGALHLNRESMDKVGEILERLHLEAGEVSQGGAGDAAH